MVPASFRTFAQSVFWLESQGKTFEEIGMLVWEDYAKLRDTKQTRRIVAEIKKTKDPVEKKKLILQWLKGVVDGILLYVCKMGLQDAYLNGPITFSRGRCHELMRAKKHDEQHGGWSKETGGVEFNASLEKFKREDGVLQEPIKLPVKKVTIVTACRVAMVTFGGEQIWTAKQGDSFEYDRIMEHNAHFLLTKSGLNTYMFPMSCVTV